MNENNLEHEKMLPIIEHDGRRFMCLPNRTEMTFPDGTVYRSAALLLAKQKWEICSTQSKLKNSQSLVIYPLICYNFNSQNSKHNIGNCLWRAHYDKSFLAGGFKSGQG